MIERVLHLSSGTENNDVSSDTQELFVRAVEASLKAMPHHFDPQMLTRAINSRLRGFGLMVTRHHYPKVRS